MITIRRQKSCMCFSYTKIFLFLIMIITSKRSLLKTNPDKGRVNSSVGCYIEFLALSVWIYMDPLSLLYDVSLKQFSEIITIIYFTVCKRLLFKHPRNLDRNNNQVVLFFRSKTWDPAINGNLLLYRSNASN